MKNLIFTLTSLVAINFFSFSQTATQTIRGKVFDATTQEELIGATIAIIDSEPLLGTTTNIEGAFSLENVPVGRHNLRISMVGYKSYFVQEILVSSGKEVVLNIGLQVEVTQLDEIVVTVKNDKTTPLNVLTTLSGRQFTVEETQRYAGGLNDPARLVSSFAGVATPSISNNGISVRGNSPAGLLWRIEGVEVPSPNHFANLTIAGAGLLTVLSSQMMGNSDFYTGAFPSEYGNASSGVFDIKLRNGNSFQREHTFQAGLLGLDFASEGPIANNKRASYLFNYRYSTMALIGAFLPSDAGVLKYQDLSFKINIPNQKTGTFSLWGMAAHDAVDIEALDQTERKAITDSDNSQTSMYLFASGINHKIPIQSRGFLETSLAMTGNGLVFDEQRLDQQSIPQPQSKADKKDYKITLQSSLTTDFNQQHTNKTGLYINHLKYDLGVDQAQQEGTAPVNIVNQSGHSNLYQFYSQSKIKLNPKFTLNAGFHSLYFQLNNQFSFEPRVGLMYQMNKKNSLALAYGLHSKVESLPVYFIKDKDGNQPNKDLKLMKSNHLVLSFNSMLSDHLKFNIEPYYQYLNNVPVAPNGYISTINTKDNLFFDSPLNSNGTGQNIGVDITLEHYLTQGLYYLLSASLYDSKYTPDDGIERNTRFNRNYVFNGLIGKEWMVGKNKNNLFNANIRLNYMGGNRKESIDIQNSVNQKDVLYGETSGSLSFMEKHPDLPIVSVNFAYRKNKPKYSSIWSLQILNLMQTEDFESDYYNLNTQTIEQKYAKIVVPNLSYKIEF